MAAHLRPNGHFQYPPGVNPEESAVGELVSWSAAMAALSGLAVALRFIARYLVRDQRRVLHIEDWLALAALPFAWMMCFIAIWGSQHDNFGQHLGASTPASLRRFLIGLWVFEHAYNFAITIAKLSIIALWWRIFDVKSCHICLVVVGVLEILWLIATTFTLIFSCTPVSGFWDLTIKSDCIVQSRFWIGAAVANITFDLVLLVLPNFWIIKLSISKSQKIALCFIFMLGIFVTVCSSLRLWQLILYNEEEQTDLPWVMVGPAIWSLVEGNLSVVCCCLPSMRPLLRLLVNGRLTYGYEFSRNNRGDRPAPTPIANANAAWGIAGVQMKPIPDAKILESPTSPQSATNDNWPLVSGPQFATAVYPTEKPESAPHRPRTDSFSTRVPASPRRLGHESPTNDHDTWLNLADTSNGGSTRPVSDLHDSEVGGSAREERGSGGVSAVTRSRTDTCVSVEELHRQLSVASVGAARSPRF